MLRPNDEFNADGDWKMRPGLCIACLSWFAGSLLAAYSTFAGGEQLAYRVSYQGVFSFGEAMPIADLTLRTDAADGERGLAAVSLDATSAPYALVESLYPIRYRLRSWAEPGQGDLVAFESYEHTRKRRHRLYLRSTGRAMVRLDLESGAGREQLAQLIAGGRPDSVPPEAELFDRLGLLQWLRAQRLSEGAEFRLPVTNGEDDLVYRVRVEAAQTLHLDGGAYAAWKLRMDGSRVDHAGAQEPVQRPVYLWLSRDARHLPLRVDSRHPIGLFRVELRPSDDDRLAAATD